MLLVLGMCFFAGGTKYAEQEVMSMASQLNSSLLFTSVLSLLIPAAFHLAVSAPFDAEAGQLLERPLENSDILAVSRGVAVILVFICECLSHGRRIAHTRHQTLFHASCTNWIDGPTDPIRHIASLGPSQLITSFPFHVFFFLLPNPRHLVPRLPALLARASLR